MPERTPKIERTEWKHVRENVLFSSYEQLKTALIKEMHERGASEAELEIGHPTESVPFVPALGDRTITFKVRLRGTHTPAVYRDNQPEGDLFPSAKFAEWWADAFTGPFLSLETSAFRLIAIQTGPVRTEVAQAEEEDDGDELGIENGPREEKFDEFLFLQERALDFFRDIRADRGKSGKIEAVLEAHGANGQIAQFRIEHPGSRATVVWLYDGEDRFNILKSEVRLRFAELMKEYGVAAPYTLTLREKE